MTRKTFDNLPRPTKLYISVIVVAGAAMVCQSTLDLATGDIGWNWTVLALLTLLSGSATVALPGMPATVSVSETFVFTSVLLFGPAAGTVTVALDAAIISFWSYRKGQPHYKTVFNVCAVPLTLWLASQLYYALSPYGPLYLTTINVHIGALLWPLLAFTVAYYAINTWLI